MAAPGQDEIIAIVRSSARGVISADGVTFALREYSHCHTGPDKPPDQR